MKGISIDILRSDLGDCTAGGVSSPDNAKGKIFVVFDDAIKDGNYDLDKCKDNPRFVCLKVNRRIIGREYLSLEPMDQPTGVIGPMMGGNYGHTSDGRFRVLCDYPLPIHDRFETQAQYDANFD